LVNFVGAGDFLSSSPDYGASAGRPMGLLLVPIAEQRSQIKDDGGSLLLDQSKPVILDGILHHYSILCEREHTVYTGSPVDPAQLKGFHCD
jgi:hypothetical protein